MNTSQPAEVLFAAAQVEQLRRNATLPAKFEKLLKRYPMNDMFGGKSVAIKIHVGSDIGYTTIHPIFIRLVVDAAKQAGGRPFVTDGSGAMPNAKARGYTEEVLGAPLLPAAGIANKYAYTREVNYRSMETVDLCGNIVDADALIVLSHGKGHGNSGFGGAIKNIAMGCVARDSRSKIHRLQGEGFHWDRDLCEFCRACVENCPSLEALWFDDQDQLRWFDHHCRFCRHCEITCPTHAITIPTDGREYFQRGMAIATREVLKCFAPSELLYINVLVGITPYCDCWGFSTPSLVPDIGITASSDIVAIEQASLDLIRTEDFIPTSLPPDMQLGEEGHLLERIHGMDPYLQVRCAEEEGLGTSAYDLVTVGM